MRRFSNVRRTYEDCCAGVRIAPERALQGRDRDVAPKLRIASPDTSPYAGIVKRQTASEYLEKLSDIGVLTEMRAGREKLFIHPRLLTLLTCDDHSVARYSS